MDVIIDANIIRRDLKLRNKNFEILLDYLSKTNSRLIFPSIVIEEIEGLFKRALKERYEDNKKSLNKLKSTLVSIEIPELPEINIEEESKKYINFLHEKLGTTQDNIINYKNEYLPELVRRAIERKKPLNENGQQFRDGILWLTILDYTNSLDEKRVSFISDNPKDFAEKKDNQLNVELQNEVDEKGIEVIFFRTLESFAKEHASTIEFVNEQWIKDSIDLNIIEKLFAELLDSSIEERILDNIEIESNESKTGYINRTDYLNSNLVDFYVYEKSDKTILLNLEYEIEVEYEIEIERAIEKDKSRYDYIYNINKQTGEQEMDMVFIPDLSIKYEHDYKSELPLLRGRFILSISNEKITNYELKDWDWG